jgi:hypothetical protein
MDTEKMKNGVSNEECCFELDREEVKAQILAEGVYKEDGFAIQKWEGDKLSEFYVVSANKNNYNYKGVLNSRFQRHNYGVNHYNNGDVYFGGYDNDFRDKHGAYLFAPVEEEGYIHNEMYFGLWKDNNKDHHGIYTWIKQKQDTEDFENADMDAFVGDMDFEGKNMKRGCYFSKNNNNFYIYYGAFDTVTGSKNDNRAFIYDNQKDRVFCGKILKDKFVNGYMMFHDSEGNFLTMVYIEFDENQAPTQITKYEDIEEGVRDQKVDDMSKFRALVFEEDCFIKIYEKWTEVKNVIKNDIKDEQVFNDENAFPKLMKLASSYNDITLYRKLEKIFKKSFWTTAFKL